ncbi:MAG TPA: Fe-S cluster assembly protein SufD [Tepidisphaeraceae bacterium]|nr:Fe-S cluster assembly protein SufD [Tepidisphaeraceae bacterium]
MTDLKQFTDFDTQLKTAGPAWLGELRQRGVNRFHKVGFPGARDEDWRHTNINPIVRGSFDLAAAGSPELAESLVQKYSFGEDAAVELVFLNGHFSAQFSKLGKKCAGVTIGSLAKAAENSAEMICPQLGQHATIESSPFVALNTGVISDGAIVHIARNLTFEGVIHLLFVNTKPATNPAVSHPRVLVVAEDNVGVAIVETYAGDSGRYWTNAVTEIVCGKDCRIDHNKFQQESRNAYHTAVQHVRLDRGAQFVSHSTTLGGLLTRNDLICHMAGDGAYATLNGLVILSGEQHCDNHTLLDHAMPNCPSHELYKHVLDGAATAVFKGKILVRKDAQKTDSKQNSKGLLLSDRATFNAMPALEIYADDVKCTHGSTTGPVDDEAMYYIRSRGVSLEAARHLLTYAFAADVTRRIKVEPVRRRIETFMAEQHGLPQDLRIQDLASFDEDVL